MRHVLVCRGAEGFSLDLGVVLEWFEVDNKRAATWARTLFPRLLCLPTSSVLTLTLDEGGVVSRGGHRSFAGVDKHCSSAEWAYFLETCRDFHKPDRRTPFDLVILCSETITNPHS
jgi:hypothetical protein